MKRMITLTLATIAFVAVQAQNRGIVLGDGSNKNYPSENGRDVVLGGGNNRGSYPSYPNGYPNTNGYPNRYPTDQRQVQIVQINREYDAKICSIRDNRYLSYQEKERSIRQLERDRQIRIQQINDACNNGNNYGYNDNNRRHKGWFKKNRDRDWNRH